jgi:hypothetical protein
MLMPMTIQTCAYRMVAIRMFTLWENMLLGEQWTRSFELESV